MTQNTFEGAPCQRCNGTTRYITDKRCVTCRRKYISDRYYTKKDNPDVKPPVRVQVDPRVEAEELARKYQMPIEDILQVMKLFENDRRRPH